MKKYLLLILTFLILTFLVTLFLIIFTYQKSEKQTIFTSYTDYQKPKNTTKPKNNKKIINDLKIIKNISNNNAETSIKKQIKIITDNNDDSLNQKQTELKPDIILNEDNLPMLIQGELPKYPQKAKNLGIEGFIKIKLFVSECGKIENYQILESENRDIFLTEVINKVQNWQFSPYLINHKPTKFSVIKSFYFKY